MTRRPCGAQLHDDEALFSLGARGTLARCGLWRRLGGSRREPPGGPRGPPSVCSIPPPGLRLRAVYAAQVCFWMVCICGLCILGATVVPMGMGCWLGAALRRLPLLRLSEISSNDFDWMLRMETDISGWDTSRVTNTQGMFYVRSSPRSTQSAVAAPFHRHAACTPRYRMPPPASRPAAPPHRVPCLRPSACYGYGRHVHMRCSPAPCPPICRTARPAHTVRIRHCLHPSAARVQVQPATELGHSPRHEHAANISSALLPAPLTQICSLAPSRRHAACIARRLPTPAPPPAPHRVP